MAKLEKEKHTEELPRVRIKPSQLKQLRDDAGQRGYGSKLATYIRIKLFGGPLTEPQAGMPVEAVLQNLADLRRLSQTGPGEERRQIYQRILKRHLDVATQSP